MNCQAATALQLMVLLSTLGSVRLGAQSFYNSFGKFTVDISPASTIFNDSLEFNGNDTRLNSFAVNGTEQYLSGSVSVHFQADPGTVFTGVFLGFGSASWSNASFGEAGYLHQGAWTVYGGHYEGATSYRDTPEHGITHAIWDVLDVDNGTFSYKNRFQGSGGRQDIRDFMDHGGIVHLDNVTAFDVLLSSTVTKYDDIFYSGYDVQLHLVPTTMAQVPEPLGGCLVTTLACGFWGLLRRSRSRGA